MWKPFKKGSYLNMIGKRWFHINNFHMRQKRWRFIPNYTKFGVFELCKRKILWNSISQWCSFIRQKDGMTRGPERCLFLTVPLNTGHWKSFEIELLIIMLYSYWHAKSVFRWKYLQKLLKPVHERLKEEGHNLLLMTCLPTDSKLEGPKNVNATVGLLCKLHFVIHSVISILKLIEKKDFLFLSLH